MSQPPEQPGTPESSETPANPSTPPTEPTPAPARPASAQPAPTQAQVTSATAPAPRRSVWGDALSTTGGKVAVIVAGASLGLITLLLAGLVVGALARHLDDDRARGPFAGDSREMPGPDRNHPGRGPDQMPPGQERRDQNRGGAGELPGLGLPGVGAALHGEVVVPGDGTATQTILFQRGEVTAVTADKLTVKSSDGFSATYTIGADTRERLKNKLSILTTGDQVTVIADKDGNETLRILKTGRAGPTN